MKRSRLLVLLALVLAGGLVMYWRSRDDPVRPIVAGPPVPQAETPRVDDPLEVSDASSAEPAVERVASVDESLAVEEAAPAPESKLAVVRGRILLEGGAPAAGVTLQMSGWHGNSERVREFGEPEHWEDPSGTSTADGRFELSFDPPRAYQFTLDASHAGYAAASWRWSEIEPGSVVDVGDVVLARAGVIVGRIVDRDGQPLPNRWVVYADGAPSQLGGDRDETRVHAIADPNTAEFRLEGVPPGPVRLSARAPNVHRIDAPIVEVGAGEEVEVLICYEGPDVSRTLTVSTYTQPFHGFAHDVGPIRVLREGVEVARAEHVEGSSQSFACHDLDPGEYEVVIEDERFEPWSKRAVVPGKEVHASLVGSAGVLLDVHDSTSGEHLPRYELDLAFVFHDSGGFSPNVFRIQEADADPPADGAFFGLIPHDCELIISVPGYATATIPVDGLAPNERRSVTASLVRGSAISALVSAADGAPVPGAEVALYRGIVDESTLADFWTRVAYEEREGKPLSAETDPTGRCSFADLAGGPWTLVATSGPARVFATVQDAPGSAELVLPALAHLSGMVRGSAEVLAALVIGVEPAAEDESALEWMDGPQGLASELDERGGFRVGPMTPGDWVVGLILPRFPSLGGLDEDFEPGGWIEIDRVTVAGGEELQREYALGDRAPGVLHVESTTNGSLTSGAVIVIHRVQLDGTTDRDPEAMSFMESGSATLGPVFPGTWCLVVHDTAERWSYAHPSTITIEPDGEASSAIAFELVSGRLEVHDVETGEPLESWIRWTCETTGFSVEGKLETNARGIVEALLPPGEYRFFTDSRGGAATALVNWSASGPVPAVLALPRPRR